jgi:hypothetical protein
MQMLKIGHKLMKILGQLSLVVVYKPRNVLDAGYPSAIKLKT